MRVFAAENATKRRLVAVYKFRNYPTGMPSGLRIPVDSIPMCVPHGECPFHRSRVSAFRHTDRLAEGRAAPLRRTVKSSHSRAG